MTKALRVAIWVLAVVAMAGTVIAQPKQIRVGGNVQQMNLVKKVAPTYPVPMKAQGLEAVVLLNVVFSRGGADFHQRSGHDGATGVHGCGD